MSRLVRLDGRHETAYQVLPAAVSAVLLVVAVLASSAWKVDRPVALLGGLVELPASSVQSWLVVVAWLAVLIVPAVVWAVHLRVVRVGWTVRPGQVDLFGRSTVAGDDVVDAAVEPVVPGRRLGANQRFWRVRLTLSDGTQIVSPRQADRARTCAAAAMLRG